MAEWEFERAGETLRVDPVPRLVMGAGGADAMIDLAIAGQGFVYIFRNWLDPTWRAAPWRPPWATGGRLSRPRLYFSSRFMPTPLRAFVDFIAKQRGSATQLKP